MWKALLLAAFPLAAIAVPATPESDYELQRREAQLGRRSWPDEGFKGIYWEHADNITICSKEKRDVLMQTVKNLDVLLGNSQESPADIDWSMRPEWERFMGGRRNGVDKSQPKHNWFIDEGKPNYVDKLQKVRANILSSIAAAASFPRNGHRKPEIPGQPSMRRITFLCEGPGERIPGHCADTQRRPAAYTTVPETDGSMGWSITFCDRFFEFAGGDTPHTFLDRVLADGYNANIKRLETYEHMMLHEYMHAKIMGHPVHIIDEQDTLPSVGGDLVNVYGATWSSEFAHVKYLTEESVNTRVATNADNYAWLITNYFVRRRWPTDPLRYLDDNTPKLLPPTKKRNVQHQQQKRQDAAPAADDIKWPRNCKWDTQPIAVQCEEINMDYEEYVADLSSLSDDCQKTEENGPFAALNPAHPGCVCTDHGGAKLPLTDPSCKGYVGYHVQCKSIDGTCGCSNGSDGTVFPAVPEGRTCESLSVGESV